MNQNRIPLLELRGVTKFFGETRALREVTFNLERGEVHALMGENGAGKSTLMKILSGNYQPDSGRILIDGEPVTFSTPRQAKDIGISVIHQELNVVKDMTVAENLALGSENARWGVLDRKAMINAAVEKLSAIGADLDPKSPIRSLSTGMQQMVEIARAVAENARVLVLDEPTASLTRSESESLYAVIAAMKARGVGLIYISHRMEEVWRLADRITVLRDGERVSTASRSSVRPHQVVKQMVGREILELYSRARSSPGEVLLAVEGITDGKAVGPVSFTVCRGEVVCLAGLIGSGRSEVARMIFGADRAQNGTINLDGQRMRLTSPRAGMKVGLGMLPESRQDQGLFLDLSTNDNISIGSLRRLSRLGIVSVRKMATLVEGIMTRLNIRGSARNIPARGLSGGNQQKLLIARWLARQPKLLIFDEPTRGVDIGAKSEIYKLIGELAVDGVAVLLVSSDLPEVVGISDRVVVMRHGKVADELVGDQISEANIIAAATATAKNGVTTDYEKAEDAA